MILSYASSCIAVNWLGAGYRRLPPPLFVATCGLIFAQNQEDCKGVLYVLLAVDDGYGCSVLNVTNIVSKAFVAPYSRSH